MPKSEAEHDNTKRIITPKKKTSNPPNLFIYILIVAEVERFRSMGSLLACEAYRPLSC
jgi:hypothetical protein